ncbi:MAG TPA: DUF3592 domain-containing protein [Phycisphaerales bacterium]
MPEPTPRWPQLLAAVIAIGFAVGVLAFDVFVAVVVTRQIVAQQTWKTAQGTIVSSVVTASRRGNVSSTPGRPRGSTTKSRYGLRVSYTYSVDGKELVSERISIASFGDPSFRHESEAAGVYPQGSPVTVYYNPADPSQSALRVGLQPEMAVPGFILLTFNAALFYAIRTAVCWWRVRRDPIRVFLQHDDGNRALLRLTSFSALDLAVVVVLIGSFISVFVVAFAVPTPLTARAALALVLIIVLSAAAAFLWRNVRLNAGHRDIVVDRTLGRLSLPLLAGEREPAELRLSDIDRIEVVLDHDRLKNRRVTRRLIVHAAGLAEPREVARWLEASEAKLLAGWLRRESRLTDEADPEDD